MATIDMLLHGFTVASDTTAANLVNELVEARQHCSCVGCWPGGRATT